MNFIYRHKNNEIHIPLLILPSENFLYLELLQMINIIDISKFARFKNKKVS